MTTPYVIEADATTYFADRFIHEAWDDATSDERTRALKTATRLIDRLNFSGDKVDATQELQFPRGEDTEVPQAILDACCELAYEILDGKDPETELRNLVQIQVSYAGVRTTYDRSFVHQALNHGIVSYLAWSLLKPYLRDSDSVVLKRST